MKPGKTVKILIINNAEPGISEFSKPLERIVSETDINFHFETIEYPDCQTIRFKSADGILLTGSPQGNDIVEHHLPYFTWLKTNEIPVLGICAGHHITGYIFGAKLYRSKEPESGDYEVETVMDDPIFSGMPQKFKVKQMHNDSISLPSDFKLLATSKTCKNQIMKHWEKPIYTCQFHPEFYNHDLVRNFLRIVERKSMQTD
ncbi:hypothetical protein D1164_03880 [Mariniphaga sediminis]|uniref:Glutamine amidotransferase domain-containing protein n=1 Tax=Mariniphaga sediminis TaxID=1628158 RepID=A0A399D4A2_9BACT|nr:homoserine O-succinyltransferase [Mariniphaga sediminis]RIH66744.1 hypothetical protein D1164_03880 [Mariniphaga sediminis]